MADNTVWVPVLASMKGFIASVNKGAADAAASAGAELEKGLGAAGRRGGENAAAQLANAVDAATKKVVAARQRETGAAADLAVAEQQLDNLRSRGDASASQVAKAESAVENARRVHVSMVDRLKSAETDLDTVRSGGEARASVVVSAENRLADAQLKSAKAADTARVSAVALDDAKARSARAAASLESAEATLAATRSRGDASAREIRSAEAAVNKARSESDRASVAVVKAEGSLRSARSQAESATDQLRAAELRHKAALDEVASSAGRADSATDELSSSMKGLDSGLKNSLGIGAVAGVFSSLTSQATTALGGLTSEAISASDATDKFKSTMSFAGMDTSVIDQVTKQTQTYADQTVYDLADIQNMTAQLASNGVDNYEGLAEAAGNLNAIAGGNAETFKSVGMVMSQTAGAGKLTTENWNQLSDAIPGASGKIQQALLDAGAYTGNFRDAMADGQITAEEFNNAVMQLGNQPVAVEAAKSTATFEGMLGNLKATITGGLADGLNQIKPQIGEVVNAVSDFASTALPAMINALVDGARALADFGGWLQRNAGYIGAVAAPVMVLVGAYKLLALQQDIMAAGSFVKWLGSLNSVMKLQTVFTNAQAGAQAALNLVMNANPIFLVVTAITALVAGLAIFFTKTELGKKIWGELVDKFTTGIDWVKTAFTGLKDIIVGGDFTGALTKAFGWEEDSPIVDKIFKVRDGFITAFNGIKTAAVWVWQSVLVPAFNGIKAGFEAVGTAVMWAWDNLIKPAWDAISLAARVLFAVVVTALITPLQIAWNAMSALFQWAWDTLIKPAWDAMAAGATWLWQNVLVPAFDGIKIAFQAVGAFFSWVWTALIQPAWAAIEAGAIWLWQNVLVPAFDAIKLAFQAVGDFFNWVWVALIQPAWAAVEAGATWLWQNVLYPIFEYMKAGFQAVGSFFQWVWDNLIHPAWDALGAGIQAVWDYVVSPVFEAMKTGVDLVRAGFQTAVDAITSIWDGLKAATAKPVKWVIDTVYNNGIVSVWNKVAHFAGLEELKPMELGDLGAYREGGVVPGARTAHDNVTMLSTDGRFGMKLRGGEGVLVPEAVDGIGAQNIDAMNAAAKTGGVGAVRKFIGGYADGGIVDAMTNIVHKKYPSLVMTSGYREGDSGYHGRGMAADFSDGVQTSAELALAKDIAATYPNSAELIHDAPGWDGNIKNGQNVGAFGGFYNLAQAGPHDNHVHWAMEVSPTMDFGGGVFEGGSSGGGAGGGFSAGRLLSSAWDTIMSPILSAIPEFAGEVGKWPKAIATKVSDAAKNFLVSKMPGGSSEGAYHGAVGGGVEQWRGLVEKILSSKGFSTELTDTVLRRMDQESGGNPAAINDWDSNAAAGTPSKGLMQVIDPTFQSYKDPGYDDIWDPESNIRASMNYAVAAYGSLPAAYNKAGGYDAGGVADGTGVLLKNAIAPERVLDPKMTVLFDQLVSMLPYLLGGVAGPQGVALGQALVSGFNGLQNVDVNAIINGTSDTTGTSAGTGKSYVQMGSDALTEAITGQMQDALGVFGIPDTIPSWMVAADNFQKMQANPDGTTDTTSAAESGQDSVSGRLATAVMSGPTGTTIELPNVGDNQVGGGASPSGGGVTYQVVVATAAEAYETIKKFQAREFAGFGVSR